MAYILITGKSGYVANSLLKYINKKGGGGLRAELLDLRSDAWRERSFAGADAIVHTAALVHEDERRHDIAQYMDINARLTAQLAEKAKSDGVGQFVFFSTEAVYAGSPSCFAPVVIDAGTPLKPATKYGASKLEAERLLAALSSEDFAVSVLRPPMIYGPGCPGNYGTLRRLTLRFRLAPRLDCPKSFIYIDNLCALICSLIEQRRGGVFCPQNGEPVSTWEMMRLIGEANGRPVCCLSAFNPFVRLLSLVSPKLKKAFGSMFYPVELSRIPGIDYCRTPFAESIRLTELGER